MKNLISVLLKVFEPSEEVKHEFTAAKRDLPKVYGRNWSDRGHF